MPQMFHKRVYKAKDFFGDISFLLRHLSSIINAYRSGRVPWPMTEKIMLAVTSVNGCVHCARFHGTLAHISGVEADEVAQLLQMEIGACVNDYERTALQFAQEYAEIRRNPSNENCLELRRFYGDKIADDIMLYIRLIMLGNLSGNTFDAFVARLSGKRVSHSRFRDEVVVSALAAPFLAVVNVFSYLHKHKPVKY